MSLDTGNQFDETGTSATDFDPQNSVLPNSTVLSSDVNQIAERALRRTRYLLEQLIGEAITHYETVTEPPDPFVIGPPNTFSGNTWTDSAVFVDVTGPAAADDDLRISISGIWTRNTGLDAGCIGLLRVRVVEDYGGANTERVPGGVVGIFEQEIGESAFESYAFTAHHRVITAGPIRVYVQVRSQDLSGGAGTATIILYRSARVDVDHYRRS